MWILVCSGWSRWSVWSSCSVTCASGTRRRTRRCLGQSCSGFPEESIVCDAGPCNIGIDFILIWKAF